MFLHNMTYSFYGTQKMIFLTDRFYNESEWGPSLISCNITIMAPFIFILYSKYRALYITQLLHDITSHMDQFHSRFSLLNSSPHSLSLQIILFKKNFQQE